LYLTLDGEVSKIGADVKDFNVGDKVGIFPLLPCFKCEACHERKYVRCKEYGYYGSRKDGGYAEYLNVKSWNLIKIDPLLDYKDIACLEPLAVSLHCLKRLEIDNTKKLSIVIIGAGFLGLIMMQILKTKFPNHQITAIDRNSFKLDIAKKYSDQTLLLNNDEEWEKFLEKNNFDVVVEATGVPKSFANSIKLTKEGGKCLWMGNITDDLTIDKKTVSSILRKEIKVIGTWNSDYDPQKKSDDWRESIELIMNHGIKPSEFVTNFIKLEEVPIYLKKLHDHKDRKSVFNSIKTMVDSF
jgi:L-iditol 2-dehydrogenase